MSRVFVVKKPCVIECKFYDTGDIYQPSDHMACTALKELIDHDFLEEKPIIQDRSKELLPCLNGLRIRAAYAQNHLSSLQDCIDFIEKILKER